MAPMFVDSHCHLTFPELHGRIDAIRADMAAARVDRALVICTTLEEFAQVHELALHEAGLDDPALDDLPGAVARGDARALLGKPLPMVIDLLQRVAHDAMARAAGGSATFFDTARVPAGAALSALVQWQRELLRVARDDEHPWNAALLVEALVTNGARCWGSADAQARQGRGHSLHSLA